MSVAGDRGDNDRGRRDRSVVSIDLGRRDRVGHADDEITDEGALEGVPMLDRVTGGGPRISSGADDSPKRARRNEPASRNPWTMQPRAGGAFAAGRALPAHRARPTPSPRRRPKPRSRTLRLAPTAAHKFEIAGVLILLIGLGATGALLLAHGHRAAAPPRSLVASTPQIAASDVQSIVTQKHAMSLTLERLAAEQQAAERRQARARAAAHRRGRIKTHHARPPAQTVYASTAPTVSDSSVASSPQTSSIQSSAPTTTSTAASSSSSSNSSTNQSSAATKQPAFGSSGTLGPGSSPDS